MDYLPIISNFTLNCKKKEDYEVKKKDYCKSKRYCGKSIFESNYCYWEKL